MTLTMMMMMMMHMNERCRAASTCCHATYVCQATHPSGLVSLHAWVRRTVQAALPNYLISTSPSIASSGLGSPLTTLLMISRLISDEICG